MPRKRLPAIVDKSVWEKVTKGRTGKRWHSVAEKALKRMGENQEDILSAEKFGRCKTEAEEMIESREGLALRNKVKSGKHLVDKRGVKQRDGNESVFAQPHGLRENAETSISYGVPGPARKKKEAYQ